jgi:hypothetical protein
MVFAGRVNRTWSTLVFVATVSWAYVISFNVLLPRII